MRNRLRAVLVATITLALASASTPSQAVFSDDLIDMAIDMVNPDLKPLRPALQCAAKGGNLATCAKQQGQEQLAQDPDANRIMHVIQLAQSKQYALLVSEFGVTAFCTSFGSAPGVGVVCNEFAQELISAGTYAAKQAGSIVGPAGKAALAWIGKTAGKFGCAIGFSCPRETNPNEYVVDLGTAGTFSLNKFDLSAIWQKDYAPRVAEAVKARFSDPFHYKQMLLPADTYLNRFLLPEQLGSATINQLAGGTTDGPEWMYKAAFAPFQKELNQRFAEIVNREAALRVEDAADRFEQSSGNWMGVMLAIKSEELFDAVLPPIGRKAGQRKVVDTCRTAVDQPATVLWHWGKAGLEVGDATRLNGKDAAYWAGTKRWCESQFGPALASDIAKRRKDFDQAIALGCTRKPDGTKGLVCPAIKAGVLINLTGPMGYCQRAYKASAKLYCSAAVASAPPTAPGAVAAPPMIKPQLRVPAVRPSASPPPAPNPSPSPTPSPTFTPLRPKIRIPGN